MKTYIVIFAYENGRKTLNVITKNNQIPVIFASTEQTKLKISTFINEYFGVDFNYGFLCKNFFDEDNLELFYVFLLPENIKLKDEFKWVHINNLSTIDKKLMEYIGDYV